MTYITIEDAMEALPGLLEKEADAKQDLTQFQIVLEAEEAQCAIAQREKLGKYTETQIKDSVTNTPKIVDLRMELARRQLEYDHAKNQVKVCWKTIEIFQHLHTIPE